MYYQENPIYPLYRRILCLIVLGNLVVNLCTPLRSGNDFDLNMMAGEDVDFDNNGLSHEYWQHNRPQADDLKQTTSNKEEAAQI